jgi:hypothetical protein
MATTISRKPARGWPLWSAESALSQLEEGTMPAHVPPVADERDALLQFLRQQRQAVRYAAYIERESLGAATAITLPGAAEGWPEDGWIKPWRRQAEGER